VINAHGRWLTRTWWVPAAALALIAAHVVLPYLLSHVGLSAAVVSGAVALLVVKHLGLLAMALASIRLRFRRR
jgi:hypothetical protein